MPCHAGRWPGPSALYSTECDCGHLPYTTPHAAQKAACGDVGDKVRRGSGRDRVRSQKGVSSVSRVRVE